jgi:phage-related protein
MQVLIALNAEKQGFIKVTLDEQYARLFTFVEKRKVPEMQATMKIQLTDPDLKKAVVQIDTKQPLVDFWLFSEKQELHFEHNFDTLLPGKHTLEFTYQDHLPTLAELSYLLR